MMKKVIVAGSRSIRDYQTVKDSIILGEYYLGLKPPYIIVSGKAKGPDTLAERYAHEELATKTLDFPANWDDNGWDAGFIRNEEMAQVADALIAVWDGKSRGTADMIARMVSYQKPVYVYRIK